MTALGVSMADSNITKLSTLPWPTLVGASVLLHVGVLTVGLPQILPVANPGDSSRNIPVTLVDDYAEPVAAAPASPSQSQPEAVQPQAVPIGGQNSAVDATKQTAAQPDPQPSEIREETPVADPPNSEKVSPSPQPPDVDAPDQTLPGPLPDVASQPVEGTNGDGQDNGQTAGSPTVVTIRNVDIPEQPNINDDPEPNFQTPIPLTIPSNPACEGRVLANAPIDVWVEIRGVDGQIATLPDSVPPEVETANCLLMTAINADPSRISFKPATPNSGDYDFAQQESISAIGQLTLVFEE